MDLVLRDEPGFEDARTDRVFNRRLTHRQPAAVLRATCEQDVVAGVLKADGETVHDQFDAAVQDRRHGGPRGRDHGDAHCRQMIAGARRIP